MQQLQHLESYEDKELLNYLVDGVSNVNQLVREYVDLQDKSEGVQGRIAKCRSWWFQNLNLSSLVIDMLNNGYKLAFAQIPESCFISNNQSACMKMNLLG